MKTGKLTVTAILLSLSFAISLLESFVPVNAVIPIPGLKLGLANIAVMAAFFLCGRASALCVAVFRPLMTLVLFGNVTSFILSMSGSLISFCGLMFTNLLYDKLFSFGGISVISAVLHAAGQIIAASFVVSDGAVYSYLPLLAAASSATGLINGMIMNAVYDRVQVIYKKKGRTK